MAERTGIDELLADARSRLDRVGPAEARALAARGGLIVDIRPVALRRQDGHMTGALVVDRNVLEWRLDPACPARLEEVDDGTYDLPVVVVCDEGYASSLAAVALQQLGLRRATDLAGGFQAWRAAGLPVEPGPS